MMRYTRRESLKELLAKCAAVDGFSFLQIVKSQAVREFTSKRGYEMPNSDKTVKKMTLNFFEEKKNELKQKFTLMKTENVRFSITVDEWSNFNKRYLNVTLNDCSSDYKLGLVAIKGSCTAEVLYEYVNKKLSDFGINMFNDVVASTHDGAAVMQKYGSLNAIENQMCYNHAIHLAMCDVFYPKRNTSQFQETFINESDEDMTHMSDDDDDDDDDDDNSDDDNDEFGNIFLK